MAEIATVCPYCGCGCGLYLRVTDGRVVGVSASRSHPVSQGRLCVKGWHAHELVDNPARLTRPLIRQNDKLQEASWEEALGAVAQGLGRVMEAAGPKAVGVLGSARCTNEDNYALVRFARAGLGTPNVDCSLRIQCFPELSDSEDGLGLGVSTGQIADLAESDVIFLIGADPAVEHPAVAACVYRALQRGARVVTASTRKHALARLAEVYLPVAPGSEVSWIGSLLHVLLLERRVAGEEAGDLAALRASVADLTPEKSEEETGVPAEALRKAAELYAEAKQVAVVHAGGLALSPQAGPALTALGNLSSLGQRGAAPRVVMLSLLSRNNLQGCRDMGVAPNYLPGYGRLSDEAVGRRLEQAWGTSLNREKGLSAWQMLGQVRGLYIMGDDVTRSLPDARATREALQGLEFLVVQDIFMSPAAELAHVVLPAAAFAEREGTWTSLERRVQRIHRAVDPPGEAREDWRIVADVSGAMGKPMPYESAAQIFEEIASLVPIYAGVFYPPLAVNGGIRWPTQEARKAKDHAFTREDLGVGERTAQAVKPGPGNASRNEEYPLLLAADPTLEPWAGEMTVTHTLTVEREFTVTDKDYPNGMLCLNPEDAKRLGLRRGRPARVVSSRGEAQMQVSLSEEVPEGLAVTTHAHGARLGLMEIAVDPDTGRPALSPTPISVGPAK